MKLNNKGFAVSIILYSMIAVITIVLLLILSIYYTNIHNKLNQAETIKERISGLNTLVNKVLGSNTLITSNPNLNNTSSSSERGLYKSIVTNSGKPTYYFRGNVSNNYVRFAGLLWRIVRINEDKTIKLILNTTISNSKFYNNAVSHTFPSSYGSSLIKHDIYYTNTNVSGEAKAILDNWYNTNIKALYSNRVVAGDYFCEQNKVMKEYSSSTGAQPFQYTNYVANFKCMTDGNGYGIVNSGVGLLTYDEAVLAGMHPRRTSNSYLVNGSSWWTMSPANGYNSTSGYVWMVDSSGLLTTLLNTSTANLRPVIVLKSDVILEPYSNGTYGNGTSSNPYKVK